MFFHHCPLCNTPTLKHEFCPTCQEYLCYSRRLPSLVRCPHCHLILPAKHPQVAHETDCPNCQQHAINLRRIDFIFDYIPPLDRLIWLFKNHQQPHLAIPFAKLLKTLQPQLPPEAVFMPIPGNPASLFKRHYNPANIFAKALSQCYQLPLIHQGLIRRGNQRKKSSLKGIHRFLDDQTQYEASSPIHYKHVILVDDILTTGRTLHLASQALRACGVQTVDAIVIARTQNNVQHLVECRF